VDGLAQPRALRVVVHALRMQERGDASLSAHHPRLRYEALVEIRLLPLEERIVLRRVQEVLRAVRRLERGEVASAQAVAVNDLLAQPRKFGCAMFADGVERRR